MDTLYTMSDLHGTSYLEYTVTIVATEKSYTVKNDVILCVILMHFFLTCLVMLF